MIGAARISVVRRRLSGYVANSLTTMRWSDLAAAVPGTFRLVPAGRMVDALRRDYDAMAGMILGTAPEFNDVMATVADFQGRLNR